MNHTYVYIKKINNINKQQHQLKSSDKPGDQTLEHVLSPFLKWSFSNLSPSLCVPSIRAKAAANVKCMSIYLSYSQKCFDFIKNIKNM